MAVAVAVVVAVFVAVPVAVPVPVSRAVALGFTGFIATIRRTLYKNNLIMTKHSTSIALNSSELKPWGTCFGKEFILKDMCILHFIGKCFLSNFKKN